MKNIQSASFKDLGTRPPVTYLRCGSSLDCQCKQSSDQPGLVSETHLLGEAAVRSCTVYGVSVPLCGVFI